MLIRFRVANFLSFRDSTEFNLLTGSPRRLEHHVYEPVKGVQLVKMAAVYGANGAGKSNLVKAMLFLRDLVAKGWLSPAILQFKLDQAAADADHPGTGIILQRRDVCLWRGPCSGSYCRGVAIPDLARQG